ncbi:MAG: biotin--[acetyl-CoA-carboxylase] ligase [Ferruginibacter sp.]|nr:biotin--[acetyl-CoA-carboxylase] ligase [Ferruginibacter sp.]
MPHTGPSFVILKQVDSTNNYAMAKVHAGMAKHGNAWFSNHQTQGKGQRGKAWLTGEGQNIALSVVLNPKLLNITHPFQLSTTIALALFDLFSRYAGDETSIKWPNDIYWRDRKAGGILIENKFSGLNWKWAVAGIGVNINQTLFDKELINPVSLMQITGKNFDPVELAKELQGLILKRTSEFLTKSYEIILGEYNQHLYKIHEPVRLKKDNMIFETVIRGVSPRGQLQTSDKIERSFEFGEVEWVIQ